MRAVWLTRHGGPEVLVGGDAEVPVPEEGQVLVRVEFANITFIETSARAGGPGPMNLRPPVVPGNGVGGVVVGGEPSLMGRRVVASTGGQGAYAEFAVADAANVHLVPDGLALDDAVALLADGRTAALMFDAVAPVKGERVLVEAAAGGVGTLLVQLAKDVGAEVVGAVGSESKADFVRELGADAVVTYREPGWGAGVGDVHVVFDGVGGSIGREAFRLIRAGGRMVSFGLASGEWAGITEEDAEQRGVRLGRPNRDPAAMGDATRRILEAAARGEIRPVIGQRFPLEQASEAHRAMEQRTTIGKTLLVVD